jgi:hypothetical protein
MSVSVSTDLSLTIKGISPAAGPGLVLLANPSLVATNVTQGDYFADTFVVNALTTTTALDLGGIVSGATVWIQTDLPITVTLTQNAIDNDIVVDSFLMMNTTFTALKLANASATTAANINVVVVGSRVTNPGTPGIF